MKKYHVNFTDMKNIPTAYYLPSEVEAEIERKDKLIGLAKESIYESILTGNSSIRDRAMKKTHDYISKALSEGEL